MKFKFARDGDNFMCPFQCDICHFHNIMNRDPGQHPSKDKLLLVGIRRAILDSFWGRATTTVRNNTYGIKKFWHILDNVLGIPRALPEMGPFLVKDIWGMHIAVTILQRTLDPGRYQSTIQFDKARKLRSVFSNCWGSSLFTLTQGVMAKETTKTYVTQCPTYCLWFERFVKGLHSCMGDDQRPDVAICSPLMKQLMTRIEVDYLEEDSIIARRFIARAALFYMSAYFGSLRGEEVNRILRRYFLQLNEETMNMNNTPHVVLPMFGNFKGEQGLPRCYLRRVVMVSKTGLDIAVWVKRVSGYEQNSNTKYLFAFADGTKQKGGVYEEYLFRTLEDIQKEEEGMIARALKVRDAYGVSRSFRRSSTTQATNVDNKECGPNDIERNNRWRKEDKAGTKHADLNMLQLYTDTQQSANAELKFLRCL